MFDLKVIAVGIISGVVSTVLGGIILDLVGFGGNTTRSVIQNFLYYINYQTSKYFGIINISNKPNNMQLSSSISSIFAPLIDIPPYVDPVAVLFYKFSLIVGLTLSGFFLGVFIFGFYSFRDVFWPLTTGIFFCCVGVWIKMNKL